MDDEAKWLGTKWVRVKSMMFFKNMENLTFTYTCVPGRVLSIYSTVIYLYTPHTVDLFSKPFLIVGEVHRFCVRSIVILSTIQ